MVWRYVMEFSLSEFYHLFSTVLVFLIALAFIALLFVNYNIFASVFTSWGKFFSNNHKLAVKIFFMVFLILVLAFIFVQVAIYSLDETTRVRVDEKIMIIELDDYWNFEDTMSYYGPYGYTMERYRKVSDTIDKHGFVATLGVTPYIFVEQMVENYPLSDDEEMIEYLEELDEKGYELGMHGYNHCRNSYYCPQYEEVWYNVRQGKRELERIFGKEFVSYFPPGNEWTTEQYENVRRAGFKMIGNTHVPKAYYDKGVIITPKGYDPIYVYEWYDIEFEHTSVDEWIDAYKSTNLFILQLHANTFDTKEKLEDLDAFLAHVAGDGSKVMTYAEFYDYMQEKQKEKGSDLSGNAIIEFEE